MYSIAQIQSVLRARWILETDASAPVEHLGADTRNVSDPARTLFFALSGPRHDAHRFLPDAYKAGLRHFVVSKTPDPADFPVANISLVDNTLPALHQLHE